MKEIVKKAIETVNNSSISFCRFITANDTGETGAHQAGFYIPKTAYGLFFDNPGKKGQNLDKFYKIKWQDDFETDSRSIYYGTGTRNEYRLTRFGRGFPFLTDDFTGALVIIAKVAGDYLKAYVLSDANDIDDFLNEFGMSPTDTNDIIPVKPGQDKPEVLIVQKINEAVSSLGERFPDTTFIADLSRKISNEAYKITPETTIENPDGTLLSWLDTEFSLFKGIENHIYRDLISKAFGSVDGFTEKANMILNRRKSRAGKSLEHHLSNIFDINKIRYDQQKVTEENKKPDFIFPGITEYHDQSFIFEKLSFLGAKTTCKDRWRQILNEADRIPRKHLFTLQQGISKNQIKEMLSEDVTLVVPQKYKNTFPEEYRDQILCLKDFVDMVKEKQET